MYKLNYRFLFFSFFCSLLINAQIGIGTPLPNINASLHLAEENKTLILNHVSEKSAITNPYDGMIFYDTTEKCFRGYANGEFTDCFGVKTEAVPPVVSAEGPGFVGEYISGQSLSNSSFMVTVSNNSFSLAQIGFAVTDLDVSDSNIEVSAVKYLNESNSLTDLPNGGLSFASGASYKIVYILTGTPVQPGSITGNWNKLSLNYSHSINVEYKLNCDSGTLVNIQPNLSQGLRSGVAYNGEYKITFSGANGFVFPAESYTVSGLTLSRTSVSGLDSGELIYNISGTYSGEDKGSIVFNTLYGCEIHLDLPLSCREILRLDPSLLNQDGVYKIDVDGPGIGLDPMDCYCDMSTDGGGWTLILNYLHKEDTNPQLVVRSNSFPLLSENDLGYDESIGIDGTPPPVPVGSGANSENWALKQVVANNNLENIKNNNLYWGHIGNSLAAKIDFCTVRFYAIGGEFNSIIHFKTKLVNVKNYIQIGTGSMVGLHLASNYSLYSDHTAVIPQEISPLPLFNYPLGGYFGNKGNYALTEHPFWKANSNHWAIKSDYRWEVNDMIIPNAIPDRTKFNNTHHQVWVR